MIPRLANFRWVGGRACLCSSRLLASASLFAKVPCAAWKSYDRAASYRARQRWRTDEGLSRWQAYFASCLGARLIPHVGDEFRQSASKTRARVSLDGGRACGCVTRVFAGHTCGGGRATAQHMACASISDGTATSFHRFTCAAANRGCRWRCTFGAALALGRQK